MKRWILIALLAVAPIAIGEQSVDFAEGSVQYSVLPTTFLTEETAEKYGIVRGANRAFCNISVVDDDGKPIKAEVTGSFKNLLGQTTKLSFEKVQDGEAVYYLAKFRYTEGEKLKFKFEVKTAKRTIDVEHEQEIYNLEVGDKKSNS